MKKDVIYLLSFMVLSLSIGIYSGQVSNSPAQYKRGFCASLLACLFPCTFCNPDGTACCPYEEKIQLCSDTDANGNERLGVCQKSLSAAPCAWPCSCTLGAYFMFSNCYNGCVTDNPSEKRGSLCVGQICGKSCWEKTCSKYGCCSSFCDDCCTCREDSWVRSICGKKPHDDKPVGNNNQMG